MSDNTTSTTPKETAALMMRSCYVDFMPIMQKIQYNVSILNCFDGKESKEHIIEEINKQINQAISLLKQMKNFSDNILERND